MNLRRDFGQIKRRSQLAPEAKLAALVSTGKAAPILILAGIDWALEWRGRDQSFSGRTGRMQTPPTYGSDLTCVEASARGGGHWKGEQTTGSPGNDLP